MKRALSIGLLAVGAGLFGASMVFAADPPKPALKYRGYAPEVTRAENPTPTPAPPAPTPAPYIGPVASLYLASASVTGNAQVESRDVETRGGGPVFQDPSHPARIAWYSSYGLPGWRGNNSIFAAHVNYVGYGDGPFVYLTSATIGDALYVTMANGEVYAYTVLSVEVIPLGSLDMGAIVFPPLESNAERVTLISCGGTFVPTSYGGEYNSRVILVAERYVQ